MIYEDGDMPQPTQENPEATATQTEEPVKTDTPTESFVEKEPTYTKSEVIEMMRKRVNRSHQAFFNRYKVKDLKELDGRFNSLSDYEKQISDLGVTNANLVKENAYLKNNIEPNRYGDIEAYFKGKDMKIDGDTLAQEIVSHPEWVKAVVAEAPKTTIRTLSPERGHEVAESDKEKMDRIFGKI